MNNTPTKQKDKYQTTKIKSIKNIFCKIFNINDISTK